MSISFTSLTVNLYGFYTFVATTLCKIKETTDFHCMNHNSKTLWLTKSYVRALQFTTQHELSYPDRRSSTNSLLLKVQLVALCSIPDQLLLV